MALTLTAVIIRDGDWFIAQCPELGIASQGESVDEALVNIKEACHLYLEGEDLAQFAHLAGQRPLVTTFEVPV